MASVHIPDGFIDAPVTVAAGAVAVGAVAWSLKGARRELTETSAPMAGLTAVFIFAAQMVNFPVAAGTSGHLIGAALAAILIGPYAAVLAMTVVLTVQALIFADGGLTALGLNVVNLAVLATLAAWWVFRGAFALTRGRLVVAAAAAGFVSVLAAAGGFAVEFIVGGTVPLSAETVATAMLGVHSFIGIGEAAITALVVSAVAGVRPDLVYALRRFGPRPTANVAPRASQEVGA
jgi:cobalt/nickel transport system permease protein